MSFQSFLITQNVVVGGKRTSMRLEQETWDALDSICAKTRMSRNDLCSLVEASRQKKTRKTAKPPSRTSSLRAFVVGFYYEACEVGGYLEKNPYVAKDIISRLLPSQ